MHRWGKPMTSGIASHLRRLAIRLSFFLRLLISKKAIVADGIPAHSFQVQDLDAEWKRLTDLGVTFSVAPMDAGPVHMAIFDDTCGNLIQLVQMKDAE